MRARPPALDLSHAQQLGHAIEAPQYCVGPRTPSPTRARVREDLDRLVAGARELLAGELPYERALREYFRDLRAARAGDTSVIWSIDNVHAGYL